MVRSHENVNTRPQDQELDVSSKNRGETKQERSKVYQFPLSDKPAHPQNEIDVGLALVGLSEEDPKKRAATARLIGDMAFMKKIRIPESIDPLCNLLLNDQNSSVREEAAWSLWKLGDPRAKDALLQALSKDGSINVREKAARALGLLGISDAASLMIALLSLGRQISVKLRAALASSLGLLNHEKAAKVLLKTAKDPEPIVRDEAVKSLGRLLNNSKPKISDEAYKLVVKSLNPSRERIAKVRQSAIKALRLCIREDAPTMIAKACAQDPDAETRRFATETLMCFEGQEVEAALLTALEDSHWEVRKTAARVLAEFVKRNHIHNTPRVREALSRMERMFPSGSREWRLAAQAYLTL